MGQGRRGHIGGCRRPDRRFLYPVPASGIQLQIPAPYNLNGRVSIPSLSASTFSNVLIYRLIAVVGFLDSIVAAKQNAARFGYSISPNRELVALGAANLAGSFIPGTLPAFGSITRCVS